MVSAGICPSQYSNVLEFTRDNVCDEIRIRRNTLIDVVVGQRASYYSILKYVESQWFHVQKPKVRLNVNGVFVFRFQLNDDLWQIMGGGPWMYGGLHHLLLKSILG